MSLWLFLWSMSMSWGNNFDDWRQHCYIERRVSCLMHFVSLIKSRKWKQFFRIESFFLQLAVEGTTKVSSRNLSRCFSIYIFDVVNNDDSNYCSSCQRPWLGSRFIPSCQRCTCLSHLPINTFSCSFCQINSPSSSMKTVLSILTLIIFFVSLIRQTTTISKECFSVGDDDDNATKGKEKRLSFQETGRCQTFDDDCTPEAGRGPNGNGTEEDGSAYTSCVR